MTPPRIHSPIEFADLLYANAPAGLIDDTFDAAAWIVNPQNIALRIGRDMGMAEHCGPGVYEIHVWFASHGAEALKNAHAMIDAMFERYGATLLRGETPTICPYAWLFTRRLGFKRTGMAERSMGRVILSELRREL